MKKKITAGLIGLGLVSLQFGSAFAHPPAQKQYNILYIMSDDHAAQGVGAYGGRFAKFNPSPTIDNLAKEGTLFTNTFVTNSICTPSRASIMTGQYSQTNGVFDLHGHLPPEKHHLPQEMKKLGYQTAVIGKWHLHDQPNFDYYKVLSQHNQQGSYFDPEFLETGMQWADHIEIKKKNLPVIKSKGHSSDVITDFSLDWLKNKRDKNKPFFLMHHYKAPHDYFEFAPRYKDYLEDAFMPEPVSMYAQPYWGSIATKGWGDGLRRIIGSSVSRRHNVRNYVGHYKIDKNLSDNAATHEAYQVYLKSYLRCIKGIDDNLSRLFSYLKEAGLWENTINVYTSDQGMMLGEHDFVDKRWMYEESIHMPFIVRHPGAKKKDVKNTMLVNNVDFGPTLIEMAGGKKPDYMQGRSFAESIVDSKELEDWDHSVYYRYWMHMVHHDIPAHLGIRTKKYKLMLFYGYHYNQDMMGARAAHWTPVTNYIMRTPAAWEFYDLERDPKEVINRYNDPKYKQIIADLKKKIKQKRVELNETDEKHPKLKKLIEDAWDL